MNKCLNCNEEIKINNPLECKVCNGKYCSIKCLITHSKNHISQSSKNIKSYLLLSLKNKQIENLTEKYSIITPGKFLEKNQFDEDYKFENLEKVTKNYFPVDLGSGSFGRVYLVRHKENKKYCAIKEIDKKKYKQIYGNCNLLYNEISIHSRLVHNNIIRLYNIYEDNEKIYLIMEYAVNGNLFEKIKESKKGLSEKIAFKYFIQMVNAIYYLHQNNIIHRDIKPENILIGKNNVLKLADFGWSKEIEFEKRSTFCGTLEYMAPEIVDSQNYDFSVDTWSLGILLYEMLMNHSPFCAKSARNIMNNIKEHELIFDKNKVISEECKDLIKKLLEYNPEKRLKIKDILEHSFIKKYSNDMISNKENINTDNKMNIKNNLLDNINNKEKKIEENINKNKRFSMIIKHHFNESMKNIHQINLLEKNLNFEIEKVKNKMDKLNFNNQNFNYFEDFRDKKIFSEEKPINNNKEDKIIIKNLNIDKILYNNNNNNNFLQRKNLMNKFNNLINNEEKNFLSSRINDNYNKQYLEKNDNFSQRNIYIKQKIKKHKDYVEQIENNNNNNEENIFSKFFNKIFNL